MNAGIIEEAQFHSSKITGSGDSTRLETDLGALDGVRGVSVDTDNHVVTVRYDSGTVDRNAIQRAIENAGYSLDSHAGETSAASSS